jgi:flagellar L-ring protein precursor FlgH
MKMLSRVSALVICLWAVVLGGCASAPARIAHTPEFAPVYPPVPEKTQANTGAIFSARHSDNWFGRGKSYQVGDIITVLLNEETQSTRTAGGKVERVSDNNVVPQGIVDRVAGLALPGKVLGTRLEGALTGIKLSGESKITSESSGNQGSTAKLTGALTATVVEVLNNGNLVVRGEKQMALTEGAEIIQVSGIIRPSDISPGNMVQSSRMANAQFAYRSSGALANATTPGWGTRALMKLWPF